MFSLAHSTLGGGGKSGLVIIHGLLGQGRNWRSLQRSFVSRLPGFSVTTLDLRNHGDSPHCESMSIDELAEDVAGLIHDLAYQGGPQKWSVLGHSLGGKARRNLQNKKKKRKQKANAVLVKGCYASCIDSS